MSKDDKNNPEGLDPDWAAEIADVDPIKKANTHKDAVKYKERLENIQVDSLDDEEEVKEAIPHHMRSPFEGFSPEDRTGSFLSGSKECGAEFTETSHDVKTFKGHRIGFDHKTKVKLSQGKISFTNRIDLHGYREEEAWGVLNQFLNGSMNHGHRCVLVIHGKGKGYGDKQDMGIIKSQVCTWLENSPAVLAYHTAQPKHGGSGAVYVMLRRVR